MNRLLLAALVGVWSHVSDVGAVADIQGTVALSPGPVITPTTPGRATLTITNLGPDAAPNVSAGTFYSGTFGFRTIAVVAIAETPPCRVFYTDLVPPPPAPSTIAVSINPLQGLAPGQSVVCTVGLLGFPESPTMFDQPFFFGPETDDPDIRNNRLVVQLLGSAPVRSVPAGSPAIWILLSVLCLIMGSTRLLR